MIIFKYIKLLILISFVLLAGCSSSDTDFNDNGLSRSDSKVITDRTGRHWDVTHAYEFYDMDPIYFNFGLGIGAIPSVDYKHLPMGQTDCILLHNHPFQEF